MQDALHQLIQQAVYPQHNFNELSLRVIHQPLFMRLVEHHSVDPDIPIPFPEQNSNEEDEDLSMKNAWFPGLPGHLDFSSYGNEKKTFVSINGQDNPTWIYTNFTRDHDHEEEGHEKCEMCKERRELYRRAMELDKEDLDGLNGVYESRWEEIEGRMFGSVGLSRDESGPMDEDDDDDDDEEEDGDGDVEIEDADAEDENDVDVEIEDVDIEDETENENEEEIEFIEDPNADIQNQKPSTSSFMSPVRRGTDRTKIEKCNGIKDIIFSGSVRLSLSLSLSSLKLIFCTIDRQKTRSSMEPIHILRSSKTMGWFNRNLKTCILANAEFIVFLWVSCGRGEVCG